MLRDLIEQSKAKENQPPDQQTTTKEQTPASAPISSLKEELPQLEHAGAHQHDDDSEFETEDESDAEAGHDEDSGHSMFESLLRSHLMGAGAPGRGRAKQASTPRDALHPYTQVLSVANIDECVQIENANFPEHERATREKFHYRLTKCPELSYGVFTKPTLSSSSGNASGDGTRLIGHISATRTSSEVVDDASMMVPPNWQSKPGSPEVQGQTIVGHDVKGRTIAVHSVAVLPEHHGKKVGSMLLESYIQRIRDSKVADRIAILVHDHLVKFYEKLGFRQIGVSEATFGGGGWTNMVIDITSDSNQDDD